MTQKWAGLAQGASPAFLQALDAFWARFLGCAPEQLRDGARHVVARPADADDRESPWPLRRGPICLFTTGRGWVLSVPVGLCNRASALCIAHPFETLVVEGDRLSQAWFDRGAWAGDGERGDGGYRIMNDLAALLPLPLRGWSHYLHGYADPSSWLPPRPQCRRGEVRRLGPEDAAVWRQWQAWPGPMVGPGVGAQFAIADAWGLVLDGELVSAAQLEANPWDLAWEYGVDTLPAHRSQGYATAVAQTVMAHIIAQGHIPWHYCDHYNRPSRRLLEKLGHVRYAEGLFSAI